MRFSYDFAHHTTTFLIEVSLVYVSFQLLCRSTVGFRFSWLHPPVYRSLRLSKYQAISFVVVETFLFLYTDIDLLIPLIFVSVIFKQQVDLLVFYIFLFTDYYLNCWTLVFGFKSLMFKLIFLYIGRTCNFCRHIDSDIFGMQSMFDKYGWRFVQHHNVTINVCISDAADNCYVCYRQKVMKTVKHFLYRKGFSFLLINIK